MEVCPAASGTQDETKSPPLPTCSQISYHTISQSVVGGLGDPPGAFKGPQGQKYFHNNIKTCFSLSVLHGYTVEISRGYTTYDDLNTLRANGMGAPIL